MTNHEDQKLVQRTFIAEGPVGQMADDYCVQNELTPKRMKGSIGPADPVTGKRVHAITLMACKDR